MVRTREESFDHLCHGWNPSREALSVESEVAIPGKNWDVDVVS
ncbi:hypothetical protein Plhal304r1_c012g0045101 [Plasmopara halstedii]